MEKHNSSLRHELRRKFTISTHHFKARIFFMCSPFEAITLWSYYERSLICYCKLLFGIDHAILIASHPLKFLLFIFHVRHYCIFVLIFMLYIKICYFLCLIDVLLFYFVSQYFFVVVLNWNFIVIILVHLINQNLSYFYHHNFSAFDGL